MDVGFDSAGLLFSRGVDLRGEVVNRSPNDF